jgi:threonine/homoserine/homoserine lactone efflux protein
MSDPFTPSLLSFAFTALIIEITPGPNMGYLAVLSLTRGWRAGVAAVTGVAIGHAVYGVLAALGVAAAIESSKLLYEALRWAGVVYLLWLAWEAWSSETETSPDIAAGHYGGAQLAFRRGLITNLLNPKAAVFFVTVVPTFVRPDGPVAAQTLVLSGIFVAIATVIHSLIVLLASHMQPLVSDPKRRRPVRRVTAVMLAGIAVWFAFSTVH